ncbi:hypothetical protein INT43_008847, partial [Umbelopsis isabellina]
MVHSQFTLRIRQQPEQARLSTGNERERRVIEPPPVIQISLNDASPEQECNWLQDSTYFMCANLMHPTDDNRVYTPHHPALLGQVSSTLHKLKDVNNQDGGFFVFGDLSIKAEGQFRFKFTLFKINGIQVQNIISIMSAPFLSYTAKAYPGPMEPTFLTRSFYEQGARVRVRKENSLQVSQKRKAQCEIVNERHVEQRRLSPDRYAYLRSSPLASPPSAHHAGDISEMSKQNLFSPKSVTCGMSHIGAYSDSKHWTPTVSIPHSVPISPFPSPPLLSSPDSVSSMPFGAPILPPLRNVLAQQAPPRSPTAHTMYPSLDTAPYFRHM